MEGRALRWVLAAALGLQACSPALNWRSVPVPEAALQAMLPCKPEQAARTVELAGAAVSLSMLGCDADGATFAVSYARLADPSQVGRALEHWQAATLARLGVSTTVPGAAPALQPFAPQPFVPPGALAIPQAVRTTLQGRSPDGTAVAAQAVWFARAVGGEVLVYHAMVLSPKPQPAVADTFFAGLALAAAP